MLTIIIIIINFPEGATHRYFDIDSSQLGENTEDVLKTKKDVQISCEYFLEDLEKRNFTNCVQELRCKGSICQKCFSGKCYICQKINNQTDLDCRYEVAVDNLFSFDNENHHVHAHEWQKIKINQSWLPYLPFINGTNLYEFYQIFYAICVALLLFNR